MSLDLKNLEEISSGDQAFIVGALNLFVSKQDEYTAMMNDALASTSLDEIRQAVHKMKSSVSVIGYAKIRQDWSKFETQLESGLLELDAAMTKAKEVHSKYLGIVEEVKTYLAK